MIKYLDNVAKTQITKLGEFAESIKHLLLLLVDRASFLHIELFSLYKKKASLFTFVTG
jgi:hypothetical protein